MAMVTKRITKRTHARIEQERRSFDQWKEAVNNYCVVLCGLGCDDLMDWTYRDAYEDGMSALEAARAAIRYNKEN